MRFYDTNVVATELLPNGYSVMIDLWDQWPGRRLPPMPNQLKTNVNSSTVDATLAYFPGVDELPLPMPAAPEVSAPAASSVGTGLRRPVRRRFARSARR